MSIHSLIVRARNAMDAVCATDPEEDYDADTVASLVEIAEALADPDPMPRIVLDVPGMDDCDQATLLGILRDALDFHERAQDFMAGRTITAETTPIYAPEPHRTTYTGRDVDTASNPSRQHYIETGRYLTHAEVADANPHLTQSPENLAGRTVWYVTTRDLMARSIHDSSEWHSWTETTLHFTDGHRFTTGEAEGDIDADTITPHGICNGNWSGAYCCAGATVGEFDAEGHRIGAWCSDCAETRQETGALPGHTWRELVAEDAEKGGS